MAEHDKGIRRIMKDRTMFLEFLQGFLPSHLQEALELHKVTPENLVLQNTSYISPALKERIADILYTLHHPKGDMYVSLLLEHQSTVDFLMPFRILQYMVEVWSHHVEGAGSRKNRKDFLLPPIIPMVFYDGEPSWTGSVRFTDKVAWQEAFQGYIPDFAYHFIWLHQHSAQELRSFHNALGAIFSIFATKKGKTLANISQALFSLVDSFSTEEKKLFSQYFLVCYEIVTGQKGGQDYPEGYIPTVKEMESMISVAERERKEGFREGLTRGHTRGLEEGFTRGHTAAQMEMVHRMRAQGLAFHLIAQYTGLSLEEVTKLGKEEYPLQ